MTYSICATDGECHGVAIATKAPAVGSLAPCLSRNGVVSTQATVNIPLGVVAKRLLDRGASVDHAVASVLRQEDDPDVRQIHGVDRNGNTTVHSGENCVEWFGSRVGNGYTVAGNMLSGERVVEAIAETFEEAADNPLAERLLAAIEAGEAAGGDKRAPNAQSTAIKIYDPTGPKVCHDVRVDDHDDPVAELRRVYKLAKAKDEEWGDREPGMVLQRNPPLDGDWG
ncbi:DUF1028 domain-containing protein [Halalkalirubrum salinum]|uniref:DUF1028 domain-containing protein n=1 Tax=Halalkalirubrum salinum TaxID=2563889 RepID=UPI0010FB206A|nr:DUF1028 domain-containing protein [Halalkalirubrum salinum]